MKKTLSVMALSMMSLLSVAHAESSGAYLTDSRGAVVKSGTGLCWRTGSWTPAQATKECDEDLVPKVNTPIEPSKVMEKPKQVMEVPKMVVPPRPMTINLKEYFSFDKSELSGESVEKLSVLAAKVKSLNLEVVTVTGFADRFGSDKYNQVLSEKRAAVVKEALISKGVPADKIYTEGKGESMPEVECPGKKSAKVIECLAPNRRVDVEVIGSMKQE